MSMDECATEVQDLFDRMIERGYNEFELALAMAAVSSSVIAYAVDADLRNEVMERCIAMFEMNGMGACSPLLQ